MELKIKGLWVFLINTTRKEVSDRRRRLGRFYKVAQLWANGKTEHLLNAKDTKIAFLPCLRKQF